MHHHGVVPYIYCFNILFLTISITDTGTIFVEISVKIYRAYFWSGVAMKSTIANISCLSLPQISDEEYLDNVL